MPDLQSTIAQTIPQLRPLNTSEVAQYDFTHVVEINASDINGTAGANGDTVTLLIANSPANFLVSRCAAFVKTPFATTGTLTMEVGTDGDTDNFLAATDVKTAGPKISSQGATVETEAGSSAAASDVLAVRFNTQAATGKPGDITAGKVFVFLHMVDLSKLAV